MRSVNVLPKINALKILLKRKRKRIRISSHYSIQSQSSNQTIMSFIDTVCLSCQRRFRNSALKRVLKTIAIDKAGEKPALYFLIHQCLGGFLIMDYYPFLYNPINSPKPRIWPAIAFSRSALFDVAGISSLQSNAYTLKK